MVWATLCTVASRVTGARAAAWALHQQVWGEGAYANLAWPRIASDAKLSAEDRRFATELAYGSLRRYGQWGRLITLASGRAEKALEPGIWWVLVLGAHQLFAMSTAVHAAVNETVALSKAVGYARASGLVNAVMRRLSEKTLDQWLEALTDGVTDPLDVLALRHAHPRWIVDALAHSLEREGRSGELDALLDSHNSPARPQLVLLEGAPEPSDEATPLSPRGVYATGDPGADARVAAGTARVQDEGSQLAALIAARVGGLGPRSRVLDACAGPGGKAAVLASALQAVGGKLVAIEQHPHRAELVRNSVRAFSTLVDVVTADVNEYLVDHRPWDLIVLDAPCSGLGALRRRPEARWTKSPEDLPGLTHTQRTLLASAADALAPGGHLVYVTCSPVVEETTDAVSWLCESNGNIEAVDTAAVLAEITAGEPPEVRVGQAVQLWPHRHGTDAMFIQILRAKTRD